MERLPNVSLEPFVALNLPSTSGRPAEPTMEDLFAMGEIDLGTLISRKIHSAVLLQDLLEVVYVHGDDFDTRHTPQALQRLAALYRQCWRTHTTAPGAPPSPSTSHPPPPRVRLPPDLAQHMQHCRTEYIRPCLRLLSRLLLRSLARFEPRDIAACFWSLAVIDHPDPHLLDLLARRAHFTVEWFGPQDVANTFWAFARLGLADDGPQAFGEGGLLQRLLPVASRQLREFKPMEVACLVYSLAAMGRSPGEAFLQRVVAVVSGRLREYGGRELANVMWALARMKHYQEHTFLKRVAQHLAGGRAALMQPADVSIILWAFGRLGFRPKGLLAELPAHLDAKLDAFAPQDLVCLLTTYATLEFQHPALFDRAAEAATARLHTFSPPELVHLLWAYGRFGVRPQHPHFLRLVGDRLLAARQFLTPQALALVAKSLARLRLKHEGWLTDLAAAAAAKMDVFHPDALTRLLWGFSFLQHHDARLFNLSLRRLKDMYDQYWRYKVMLRHISSVVASCDRVGARPIGYRYFAELASSGAPTPYMRWQGPPAQLVRRPKLNQLTEAGDIEAVANSSLPDHLASVPPSAPDAGLHEQEEHPPHPDPDLPAPPPPTATANPASPAVAPTPLNAHPPSPAPTTAPPLLINGITTNDVPHANGSLHANGVLPPSHQQQQQDSRNHSPRIHQTNRHPPAAPQQPPAVASHILPAPHHYLVIPTLPQHLPSTPQPMSPTSTQPPPHHTDPLPVPSSPSPPSPHPALTQTTDPPPDSQPLPADLHRPIPPPQPSTWAKNLARPQLPPRT